MKDRYVLYVNFRERADFDTLESAQQYVSAIEGFTLEWGKLKSDWQAYGNKAIYHIAQVDPSYFEWSDE